MNRVRTIARAVTIALMGALVVAVTADGFAQSYAGLLGWAHEHGLSGWKADSFPFLSDAFVAVGELGLFLLALDGHRLTRKALAWVDLALPAGTAAVGWTVSLVFNVGRIQHGDLADRVTAAVPPVAAMVGLVILLRTLHRYVATPETNSWPVFTGPRVVFDPADEALMLRDATDPDDEADEDDAEPGEDLGPLVATARDHFADVIAMGATPSIRTLRRELRIGYPKAAAVAGVLDRSRPPINGHDPLVTADP